MKQLGQSLSVRATKLHPQDIDISGYSAMDNKTILVSRLLPDPLVAALSGLGEVQIASPDFGIEISEQVGVIVSTAMDPLPAAIIESFPSGLGLIANLGVGTDNIHLSTADRRGIQVSNTPVVTEDTADLAMALLLSTCRRLSVCERLLRDDDWGGSQKHLGTRVHGKTLGIVGFGAIGQALARRAKAFDLEILYHGPNRKEDAEAVTKGRYCEDLSQLLGESDIVSLHCPLSASTRHVIDAKTLKQMKPGSILINTGRGALVDEKALVSALADGHLGGAGLDVFEFEPAVTAELFNFDNVTLLPHIGSATAECRQDIALRGLANVRQFLQDGTVLDPVRN